MANPDDRSFTYDEQVARKAALVADELVLGLRDGRAVIRANAALGLAALGLTGSDLVPFLRDSHPVAARAAAEAIGQLRQQLSDSLARNNTLLQERSQILATLTSLLDAARHAATDQRAAIDSLVAQAGALLQQAGAHHAAQAEATARQMAATADQVVAAAGQVQASAGAVEASAGKVVASAGQVAGAATEVAAGAIEVASLGEAFGAAVQAFGDVNERLA